MIRNLKVLLLAVLAVTALDALSASVAQAARFTAPGAAADQINGKPMGTEYSRLHAKKPRGNCGRSRTD